ncbi:MAG: ABC transporter permease [Candidatus Limnocylindrales bacterium]
MSSLARPNVANIVAVARREFVTRAGTRTFLISTLILVLAAAAVALAPVVISYLNRDATKVAVYVGAADLQADPVATLDALLNPPASQGGGSEPGGTKPFQVSRSTDLEADRQQVLDGKLNALLDIERDASGELVFTVYTGEPANSRTALLSRQAATSVVIADRLGRVGLTPSDQAGLFASPQVTVRSPDPSKPVASAQAMAEEATNFAVIFGLVIFLYLAIILYGTWVARSVVEEKSSRMMEIILVAASPFQLLAGKVLGVSAVALLQYAAMLAAVLVALLVQQQVASLVLGDTAGLSLPSGLTPSLIVVFSVFFVLGFLLYMVLFAAAGSLVSRQEDVDQVIIPMLLIGTAGYLISLYASIGIVDQKAPWVVMLSWVPFLSPYMMLSRLNAGEAGPLEVGFAVLLLMATIVVAVWVASRIYAAGVLMYGQKPSIRGMWKAAREAR